MTDRPERSSDFDALLQFVKAERGFDFTGYKKPSLARRIDKRLQARHVAGYDEYRMLLEQHPDEFGELFDTILINVTSFFRDEFAWSYLSEEIVPRLLAARDDQPLRVWSTGCATGEEAFTLAIVLGEAMGEDDFKRRVKIYATDVDDDALNFGRHAVYSPKQVKAVPEDLREKYFVRENHSYAFRGDLRRSVIFGRHDLVQDPPISRIDLLASRNTLMYFTPELQTQVLASFHFALRDDGYLFLGKSEALTAKTDLFTAVDLKRRVFSKVSKRGRRAPAPRDERITLLSPAVDTVIRDAGLDAVAMAFIAVDREGRLALANLQARVQFGLTQRDIGRPIQDLEISFRPVELRSRIEQAYVDRHAVALRDVAWRTADETRYLDVQVAPLTSPTGELAGAGITFSDVSRYRRLHIALQEARRDAETAGEELQATVEELETTNEELQATNEELETTNEELQATNEELETMNEELESTNEELESINEELHLRGIELNSANSFLEAILASLPAAVVVDRDLRIQAWNAGARDLWGVTTDEAVGQHLMNLDIGLPVDKLHGAIRSVFTDSGERQILSLDATNRRGRSIVARVELAPLQADGTADGVILLMEAEEAR